ncbi:MAG: LCP family protein [Clostridia bacterium]|nr:LCP family protein [Clostridia bacterium]
MPRKEKKRKKILVIILIIILAIITALSLTCFILYESGKIQFHKNDKNISATGIDGLETGENSITYNGKTYYLNGDVVSVLFMGIDKQNIDNNFGFGKNGQADSIFVAAVNTKTKKIKLIPIPRESMVDVNTYDSSGNFTGTKKEQICLAYSYGDSAKDSCSNVKASVSRFLMGINVSSYIAMDLKGVSNTTDKIGGITLNALESVPYQNRTCKVGEKIVLKGGDATRYIQCRNDGIDASTKRLERQKQFLSVFASTAGNQILSDFTKLKVYYDGLIPFVQTDLSFAQVSYLVTSSISKNLGNALEYENITGNMSLKGEWAEFTPDNDSLINAILNSFYKEQK